MRTFLYGLEAFLPGLAREIVGILGGGTNSDLVLKTTAAGFEPAAVRAVCLRALVLNHEATRALTGMGGHKVAGPFAPTPVLCTGTVYWYSTYCLLRVLRFFERNTF